MKIATDEFLNRPLMSGGSWDSNVVSKVMLSLRGGETHYVEVPGHAGLRERIGTYLGNTGIAGGGEVLVTAGVQESRFLTVQVLGSVLGRIALPQVVHPGVREVFRLRDLDHGFLQTGTDPRMLVPTAEIKKLSAAFKILYLESPSRFTGASYGKEELAEIVTFCEDRDVAIILDCGLHPWMEQPGKAGMELEIDDRLLLIGETWPGAGLEELYVGHILASPDTVKRITTQKQVISICTSAPSQNAAIAVAGSYGERHPQVVAAMSKKKAALEAMLRAMGMEPLPGSVVNFIAGKASSEVQQKLEAAKAPFAEGRYFAAPGWIQLPVSERSIQALMTNLG
jgi:aspartate/methionine/tyrosine aminotransferase